MHPTLASTHGSRNARVIKILLLWLLAILLAGLHHIFYSQLNDTAVQGLDGRGAASPGDILRSQSGASAVGTLLAFLAAAAFAEGTGDAFLQCAWSLVQRRPFTVAGLEALWSASNSVVAFLEMDLWSTARGVVLIAVIMRAFALVVTFSPGSLTVRSVVQSATSDCLVPTYDFGKRGDLFDIMEASQTDGYWAPSSMALQVVGATLLSGQPLPQTSPCGGVNCTYSMSVNAPSFKCADSLRNASMLPIPKEPTPPAYIALPFDASPLPDFNLAGAGGWDFQAHYVNYTPYLRTGLVPQLTGKNVSCLAYNSTYQLDYTFSGSASTATVKNIVQHQPAGLHVVHLCRTKKSNHQRLPLVTRLLANFVI
ncbi:hypothetical protein MKEN_01357600 [Mycena kentingensis (nom. inval.)]|nr:hypothetical protein MKEN_01357600 [Mycena kentingensis (nom. inval.)]